MFDWKKYEEEFQLEFESIKEWFIKETSKLHVGRATPSIVENLKVEAYGELMPINQLANFSIPDARTLVIKPYDKTTVKAIVAAIHAADIGINPIADADLVRLTFPAPTEDSRKISAKKAKALAEDSRIKVRKIRQKLSDSFKKEENLVEDDKKDFQNKIDAQTKKLNASIEETLASVVKDLMTI